jgi:hypothetical protein
VRGTLAEYRHIVRSTAALDPALVFLDPLGTKGIEFSIITDLMSRGSATAYAKTDLLINFSVPGVKRRMGMYAREEGYAISNLRGLAEVVDDVEWFDQLRSGAPYGTVFRDLLDRYLGRLRAAYGYAGAFPVRRSHKRPAAFYLLVVSRHPDAIELFNDECYRSSRRVFEATMSGGRLPIDADFYKRTFDRERKVDAEQRLPSFLLGALRPDIASTAKDVLVDHVRTFEAGRFTSTMYLSAARNLIAAGKLLRQDRKGVHAPGDPKALDERRSVPPR